MDDIDLSLSDEEHAIIPPSGAASTKAETTESVIVAECAPEEECAEPEHSESNVKPNFVYVNPTDEDTMVVQHILSVRMGTREIESSDDEGERDDERVKEEDQSCDEKKESQPAETEPISEGTGETKPGVEQAGMFSDL